MDRRDPMALSGSASYFTSRGITGSGTQSGIHGSPGIHPLSNTNIAFQSNIEGINIGSTLPIGPSSTISQHGVNLGAPSAVPPGESLKGKEEDLENMDLMGLFHWHCLLQHLLILVHYHQAQNGVEGGHQGLGKKQQLVSQGGLLSGSAGMGFTPHIISIAVGEDVATKIMAFSQQGPRAVCILSANGAVSTVTLRQPSTSGGTVTYEGRFEIICLSGSYLLTEIGGSRNRSGGLSVSLASPDGRVIGGGVGGMLIAATPVQVIVGSFIWGGPKTKNKKREAVEGVTDLEHETVDNSVALNSIQPDQSLSQSASLAAWQASRPLDMRNSHVDIDLMRG